MSACKERYISHAKMRVKVRLSGAASSRVAQWVGNNEARTVTTTAKSAKALASSQPMSAAAKSLTWSRTLRSSSAELEKLLRAKKSMEALEREKAEVALERAVELIQLFTQASLISAGFHTHKRQWRRKRNVG
jgi:hypothetical protein